MKVNNLGANKTEITFNNAVVFVSYKTPVAAIIEGRAYVTDCRWSTTTSKHIGQWLGYPQKQAETKPQTFFDDLLLKYSL